MMSRRHLINGWWHIEKACHRLSMPSKFIQFVMTYLRSSKTFTSTYFGPTSPFQLQNSIKKGCPLAGYLFIITLDYLYSTINDPKKQAPTPNIHSSRPPPIFSIASYKKVVCPCQILHPNVSTLLEPSYQSLGFSDELSTTSKNLYHLRQATKKIEQITYLQNVCLNADKTTALIIDATNRTQSKYQNKPITINQQPIPLTPQHESFKFIGLYIN